jgi:predicted HicB family RNase H-like nuclease
MKKINDVKLLLYLSKELKDAIEKEASQLGLSMNAYIRLILNNRNK